MQKKNFLKVPYFQCSVSAEIHKSHCGMHSHMSHVVNGIVSKIITINRRQCNEMVKENRFVYSGFTLKDLKPNVEMAFTLMTVGTITDQNSCKGGFKFENGITYKDILETTLIKLSMSKGEASVDLSTKNIILPSSTTCKYSDEQCIDKSGGFTFWEIDSEDSICDV